MKNSSRFWKNYKFIWNEKKDKLPGYLLKFFYLLFSNFSPLLLCKINVLDIFNMTDFFNFYYTAKYLNFDGMEFGIVDICTSNIETKINEKLKYSSQVFSTSSIQVLF